MRAVAAALVATLLLVAASWREEAAKLFKERKYSASAAVLERRLKDHPRDFDALMLLGICRQQLGELGKAELSFATAAQVQPANSGPRYSLARVLFFAGRFEEALAAVADAERLHEPPARVNYLRGRIEEERGRFNEALEAYRRALAADRDMADALAGEASVLYKLGRYVEARSSAKAAMRLQPDNAEAKQVAAAVDSRPPSMIRTPEVADGATAVRFARKDVIDFRLEHFPSEKKHLISTMTGGLAIFDFDNDGLMDVFFANGAEIPSLKKSGPQFWNRLFRNAGNWRFEDVTERQGLQGEGFAMGAVAGDYDNDGHVDLFVPGVWRNLLYRNAGDRFTEVSNNAGIHDEIWSVAAAWVDYDRDGWLDLFVVNYLDWNPELDRFCGDKAKGLRVYCHPREYSGLPNRLYRNRHDGTFEDVSERAGILKHIGKGMSAAVIDADNDGWPDIFVTNDTIPNFLFRNRGDGSFEEAAVQFGAALNDQGQAISSMGTDAQDYDNDGLPDLIVTALTGENFLLLRNTGKGGFQDVTFPSRLGLNAARRSGWGVAFADLNNDGWKDLFTANSHVTDNIEQVRSERYREPNTVFLNRRGTFVAMQEIGAPAAHRGAAVADLDNDGRLDAVVTVLGNKPEVWRNETDAGTWLRVKLEGQSIGAKVRVGSQWREQSSATGYASSNLDALHFGLRENAVVPEVEIIWPNGKRQTIRNAKAEQTLVVREPARP
jgi:enediyne biosynthesis protein E4